MLHQYNLMHQYNRTQYLILMVNWDGQDRTILHQDHSLVTPQNRTSFLLMVSWDGEPYIYNRLGTRDNLLFPGLFRGIGTVRFWYPKKLTVAVIQ